MRISRREEQRILTIIIADLRLSMIYRRCQLLINNFRRVSRLLTLSNYEFYAKFRARHNDAT